MLEMALAIQSPPVATTPIADLLGLSPQAVAIAVGAPAPEVEPLRIVENGRSIAIYPGNTFRPRTPEALQCATQVVETTDRPPFSGTEIARWSLSVRARFIFEDERLVAVRGSTDFASSPPPVTRDRRAITDHYRQAGGVSEWSIAPGYLPLSEGAAFVDRVSGRVPVGAVLATSCRSRPVPASPTQPARFDSTGFLQGLALLPFAWTLPGLNAERDRDAREGPALLAAVRPGDLLPGGVASLVRDRPGTELYRDATDADYGIVVVSVGSSDRRNLARRFDVGMIGIRGDRVIWTASPEMVDALALKPSLCTGRDGRLGNVRRGCTRTGTFTFDR